MTTQPKSKPSPSGRIQRTILIIVILATAALLPVATYRAKNAHDSMEKVQQDLVRARKEATELARMQAEVEKYERFQENARAVQTRASSHGLTRDNWSTHQIDVPPRQLSRRDAIAFISGAVNKPGYFFVPERFTLETVGTGDNLFQFNRDDVDQLVFALSGTYYTQGSQ